jgi:hypothetical protein
MKSFLLLLGLSCWFAAVPLRAAEVDPLQRIREQQTTLQTALDSRQAEALTPRQVKVIRKAQGEVFALIEGKSRLDELAIDDQVRLENALERINAEVKGTRLAGEEKTVCWRERPSGSMIEVTRCGTQEEIDEARRGARAFMERPRVCVPPGCGS